MTEEQSTLNKDVCKIIYKFEKISCNEIFYYIIGAILALCSIWNYITPVKNPIMIQFMTSIGITNTTISIGGVLFSILAVLIPSIYKNKINNFKYYFGLLIAIIGMGFMFFAIVMLDYIAGIIPTSICVIIEIYIALKLIDIRNGCPKLNKSVDKV